MARSQRRPQLTLSSDFADLAYPGSGSPFGTDYISDWSLTLALSAAAVHRRADQGRGRVGARQRGAGGAATEADRGARRSSTRGARHCSSTPPSRRWEASAGTEEQAARAYQIAELRYREGISTQTELNDLRIQLAQAQSTRARAARDLQVAKIRLALLPALPLPATAGGTGTGSSTAAVTGSPAPAPATSAPVTGSTSATGGTLR